MQKKQRLSIKASNFLQGILFILFTSVWYNSFVFFKIPTSDVNTNPLIGPWTSNVSLITCSIWEGVLVSHINPIHDVFFIISLIVSDAVNILGLELNCWLTSVTFAPLNDKCFAILKPIPFGEPTTMKLLFIKSWLTF